MKYVKIWDSIYLIDKITEKYARIHDTDDDLYIYHHDIKLDDNRAQFSDTIEELCDCYIYIDKCLPNSTPKIYCDWNKLFFENNHEEELGIERNLCEIYGAIWTDKGLIYVTKMNDKGELELI